MQLGNFTAFMREYKELEDKVSLLKKWNYHLASNHVKKIQIIDGNGELLELGIQGQLATDFAKNLKFEINSCLERMAELREMVKED